MKSVRANIVEDYGRLGCKQDFIRFLTYAHAPCDETIDHLKTFHETGSLNDPLRYERVHEQLDRLGVQLNLFLKRVADQHLSVREGQLEFSLTENHL